MTFSRRIAAAAAASALGVLSAAPVAAAQQAQPPTASAPAHLQRGNDAYSTGDLPTAATSYEACLAADPSLRYCAVNLASVLIDLGDPDHFDRAETLYRSALETDPTDGDTSFNLATLLQDQKTDRATREAAELYGVAVKAEPDRWDAWANLATTLAEMGDRPLDAVHAFERSILLIERGAEESGEGENVERDAYLSKLYYGYGTTLAELNPEACQVLSTDSRSLLIGDRDGGGSDGGDDGNDDDDDEETANNMKRQPCTETALNAMREAAILDATNVQASHMLAAMASEDGGSDGVHRRASPEFVAALFDDFADTFDEKLGALEYNVPAIIGAAAAKARSSSSNTPDDSDGGAIFRSALDAGCGTGLAGRYLRPLVAGPMVGVDISQKMLDNAAKCTLTSGCGIDDDDAEAGEGGDSKEQPLYDGLMALDLEAMTLEETLLAPDVGRAEILTDVKDRDGFDLVVAADVLVYFGRLDTVLGSFAKLSRRPGASLLFTCERASDEEAPLGWRLLASGRFAHTKKYVLGVTTELGYVLEEYEEIVPRMERGVEVKGHIFHFVLSEGNDSDSAGQKEEL